MVSLDDEETRNEEYRRDSCIVPDSFFVYRPRPEELHRPRPGVLHRPRRRFDDEKLLHHRPRQEGNSTIEEERIMMMMEKKYVELRDE